jgi:hypothetical protein
MLEREAKSKGKHVWASLDHRNFEGSQPISRLSFENTSDQRIEAYPIPM